MPTIHYTRAKENVNHHLSSLFTRWGNAGTRFALNEDVGQLNQEARIKYAGILKKGAEPLSKNIKAIVRTLDNNKRGNPFIATCLGFFDALNTDLIFMLDALEKIAGEVPIEVDGANPYLRAGNRIENFNAVVAGLKRLTLEYFDLQHALYHTLENYSEWIPSDPKKDNTKKIIDSVRQRGEQFFKAIANDTNNAEALNESWQYLIKLGISDLPQAKYDYVKSEEDFRPPRDPFYNDENDHNGEKKAGFRQEKLKQAAFKRQIELTKALIKLATDKKLVVNEWKEGLIDPNQQETPLLNKNIHRLETLLNVAYTNDAIKVRLGGEQPQGAPERPNPYGFKTEPLNHFLTEINADGFRTPFTPLKKEFEFRLSSIEPAPATLYLVDKRNNNADYFNMPVNAAWNEGKAIFLDAFNPIERLIFSKAYRVLADQELDGDSVLGNKMRTLAKFRKSFPFGRGKAFKIAAARLQATLLNTAINVGNLNLIDFNEVLTAFSEGVRGGNLYSEPFVKKLVEAFPIMSYQQQLIVLHQLVQIETNNKVLIPQIAALFAMVRADAKWDVRYPIYPGSSNTVTLLELAEIHNNFIENRHKGIKGFFRSFYIVRSMETKKQTRRHIEKSFKIVAPRDIDELAHLQMGHSVVEQGEGENRIVSIQKSNPKTPALQDHLKTLQTHIHHEENLEKKGALQRFYDKFNRVNYLPAVDGIDEQAAREPRENPYFQSAMRTLALQLITARSFDDDLDREAYQGKVPDQDKHRFVTGFLPHIEKSLLYVMLSYGKATRNFPVDDHFSTNDIQLMSESDDPKCFELAATFMMTALFDDLGIQAMVDSFGENEAEKSTFINFMVVKLMMGLSQTPMIDPETLTLTKIVESAKVVLAKPLSEFSTEAQIMMGQLANRHLIPVDWEEGARAAGQLDLPNPMAILQSLTVLDERLRGIAPDADEEVVEPIENQPVRGAHPEIINEENLDNPAENLHIRALSNKIQDLATKLSEIEIKEIEKEIEDYQVLELTERMDSLEKNLPNKKQLKSFKTQLNGLQIQIDAMLNPSPRSSGEEDEIFKLDEATPEKQTVNALAQQVETLNLRLQQQATLRKNDALFKEMKQELKSSRKAPPVADRSMEFTNNTNALDLNLSYTSPVKGGGVSPMGNKWLNVGAGLKTKTPVTPYRKPGAPKAMSTVKCKGTTLLMTPQTGNILDPNFFRSETSGVNVKKLSQKLDFSEASMAEYGQKDSSPSKDFNNNQNNPSRSVALMKEMLNSEAEFRDNMTAFIDNITANGAELVVDPKDKEWVQDFVRINFQPLTYNIFQGIDPKAINENNYLEIAEKMRLQIMELHKAPVKNYFLSLMHVSHHSNLLVNALKSDASVEILPSNNAIQSNQPANKRISKRPSEFVTMAAQHISAAFQLRFDELNKLNNVEDPSDIFDPKEAIRPFYELFVFAAQNAEAFNLDVPSPIKHDLMEEGIFALNKKEKNQERRRLSTSGTFGAADVSENTVANSLN